MPRRADLVERIDRFTELPMLLLAVAYFAVFVIGYLPGLPATVYPVAADIEYLIIALFAAELIVKVAVAERRLLYLRSHWLDVLIVLVPFLRPLRILRIVRILPIALRLTVGLRRVMGPYHGSYVLVVAVLAVVVSAALMTLFESAADGTITTFGDALWWAVATITTVGYGDVTPVTAEGRAIAVFLMVVGIALFGMLTAAVAAYFVESTGEGDATAELLQQVRALQAQSMEQHQALIALLEREQHRQ